MDSLEGQKPATPSQSRLPIRITTLNNQATDAFRPDRFDRAKTQGDKLRIPKSRIKPSDDASVCETPGETIVKDTLSKDIQILKRPYPSRPSLSDRAKETLTHIPPSPSPRRRLSGFFPQNSPAVRPKSSLGRSRPVTSVGQYPSIPSSVGQSSNKHPSTPHSRGHVSYATLSKGANNSSLVQTSRMGQVETSHLISGTPTKPQPSRTKTFLISSKDNRDKQLVESRPSTPHNGKPMEPISRRIGSHLGSSKVSRPGSEILKRNTPTETQEMSSPPKTSAALREIVTNARSARKAALGGKGPSISNSSVQFFEPQNSPDRGMKKRISSARTDGRLNISAMDLKAIPDEVLTMYELDSMESSGRKWFETVDLVRLNAADNELEDLSGTFGNADSEDEAQAQIFQGLESLDLHGNRLSALPSGLLKLSRLTILNLSRNHLKSIDTTFHVVCQMPSLQELYLAENGFSGPMPPIGGLQNLESFDIRSNALNTLSDDVSACSKLRTLDVSNNKLTGLPAALCLPNLRTLNLSLNCITNMNSVVAMSAPHLTTFDISGNRISYLPPLQLKFPELEGLLANWNSITEISAEAAKGLKTLELKSNDIKFLPPELGLLDQAGLTKLLVSGNPMRVPRRGILEGPTEGLMAWLRGRLPEGVDDEMF
ncbi:MAG: hypothetical protein LQ351_004597 [Letrouitia transgressa]|nr:MAG: hypothetical protein LQ351_004597 [Letrouitia transgressa]